MGKQRPERTWRKSTYSDTGGGNCVEAASTDRVVQVRDTTDRQTAVAELEALTPRNSQYAAGQEVPEEHWMYRIAKKHWFFGFGAYT